MDAKQAIDTLRGGLWHTTSECRFQGIMSRKAILSVPPVPEDKRWGANCGPSGWPYVRTLGGVSLFDFAGFDPEDYDTRFPACSWKEFVPYRHTWGASIWIEINRKKMADNLVETNELVARWHKEKAERHNLMPHIEACYTGDIPSGLFVRALEVANGDTEFRSLEV